MSQIGFELRTILIISFQYWPALNARAFRWTALAEDWVRRGHRVHVLCSTLSDRPASEEVNGVRIHRCGSWIERQRGGHAQSAPGRTALRRSPLRAAADGLGAAWRKVYWPDTCCTWYFSARSKARGLIQALEPEVVVSVSPAFTAVAAGYSLAHDRSRSFRWIIDLGDPFSFAEEAPTNNFHLYRGLNAHFERSCFATADAVSVTNSATRDRYAAIFPESAGKIEVIPPLISLPRAVNSDQASRTGAPKLVFLGRLYPSIRRPDFLLALFAALTRLRGDRGYELHFFGESWECAKSFEPYRQMVGRSVFLHEPVPRDQVAEQMHSAHALINIGNTTGYQLPSKIVEYAASGKPILNIAAFPDDISVRFLAGYPAHLALTAGSDDPSDEDLRRLVGFLESAPERIPEVDLRNWLAPFTLPRVSSSYLALLARRNPGTIASP